MRTILMCLLEETQRLLVDKIFKQDNKLTWEEMFNDSPARILLYKSTIAENLNSNLKEVYPSLWVLLGNECANSLATVYNNKISHLPTDTDMQDHGSKLYLFVKNISAFNQIDYLSDYILYLWLYRTSTYKKQGRSLKINALKKIEPTLLGLIRFNFNTVYFMHSKYDLEKIESFLDKKGADKDLKIKTCNYYYIFINGNVVQTIFSVYFFIRSLIDNNLEHSIENTLKIQQDFNASEALQFIFNHKLIKNIVLKEE